MHHQRKLSSAERRYCVEQDPLCTQATPTAVLCKLCRDWVKLGRKGYHLANWTRHCQHHHGRSDAEVTQMRKSALDKLGAMDAVAHAAVLAGDAGSDAAASMDTPDTSPRSQLISLPDDIPVATLEDSMIDPALNFEDPTTAVADTPSTYTISTVPSPKLLSAAQRKRILELDPLVQELNNTDALCTACHQWIQVNRAGRQFDLLSWNRHCMSKHERSSDETERLKQRVLEGQTTHGDATTIEDTSPTRVTKRQREEESDVGPVRFRMKSVRWAAQRPTGEVPHVPDVSPATTGSVVHGKFDVARQQAAADVAEFTILGILLGLELAGSPGFDSSPSARLRLASQLAERASPTLMHASTEIQGPGDGSAAFESFRSSFKALIEDVLEPRIA